MRAQERGQIPPTADRKGEDPSRPRQPRFSRADPTQHHQHRAPRLDVGLVDPSLQLDVIAEPHRLLVRVRVAVDAHQQADVVDRRALVLADAHQVGDPQRDPRLANRVLEGLAAPEIGRERETCHQLREPHVDNQALPRIDDRSVGLSAPCRPRSLRRRARRHRGTATARVALGGDGATPATRRRSVGIRRDRRTAKAVPPWPFGARAVRRRLRRVPGDGAARASRSPGAIAAEFAPLGVTTIARYSPPAAEVAAAAVTARRHPTLALQLRPGFRNADRCWAYAVGGVARGSLR